MSNNKPRRRATKEEKEERIQRVLECLMVTDSVSVVISGIMAEYHIEQRMAHAYLKAARKRLAHLLGGDVKSHLGLALSRANHLYAQSLQQGAGDPRHNRNALDALRLVKEVALESAKFQLLSKGSEHNGNPYEHNPLLAQLINGASTTGGDAHVQ